MKIKRTLVSAIAALALMASVMAPVAMAQPQQDDEDRPNSTTASVTVTDPGKFDVYFSSATLNFGTATISAGSLEADKAGTFRIRYIDTYADRTNFDVQVSATDFSAGESGPTFSASNLTIESTANVIQTYWGGPGRCDTQAKIDAGCNPNIDIGDIGYFVNGAYTAQDETGGVWTTKTYGLDTPQDVHFGRNGAGTGTSYGDVGVNLHIPNDTPPGDYTSVLTLNVIAGTQP